MIRLDLEPRPLGVLSNSFTAHVSSLLDEPETSAQTNALGAYAIERTSRLLGASRQQLVRVVFPYLSGIVRSG